MLVKTLVIRQSINNSAVPVPSSFILFALSISSFTNNLRKPNKHMSKVETGLEDMKSEFHNIKNIWGRIFTIVLNGQVNKNT